MSTCAECNCLSHEWESDVRKLPSPTCGRGVGGEGAVCQRIHINRVPKAPLPSPLPEGERE
jgi:hypothetical protein